jgi:hypothetical protein
LGLQDSYVKQLEWSDARHVKKNEVLEKENEVLKKKYQDVLDLNSKEYVEAQQEVDEKVNPGQKLLQFAFWDNFLGCRGCWRPIWPLRFSSFGCWW